MSDSDSSDQNPPSPQEVGTALAEGKRRCQECGSYNTRPDSALRSKPSVLWVIIIGWFFLLVRAAFTKRKAVCLDCGATEDYRSGGSLVALLVLIALVFLVVASLVGDF